MGALPASAAALLAAAALLLAGCGDDTPPPTPSSSSVPTSASPTTQSPTPQPESAEEFIRRWVEVQAEMQNSGNTTNFLMLAKDCVPCEKFARTIEGFYGDGGFVRTQGWTVQTIKQGSSTSPRHPVFVVDVISSPTDYKKTRGGKLEHLPGGPARYRFALQREAQLWFVADLMEMPRQ